MHKSRQDTRGGRGTVRHFPPQEGPPHSLYAEAALLGALMLDPSAMDKIAGRVAEEDFFGHSNRLIFRAALAVAGRQAAIDVWTLAEELDRQGVLDDVGHVEALGAMAKAAGSAANVVAYADAVRDSAILRRLIVAGHEMADRARSPAGATVDELLEQAEQQIFALANARRDVARGALDARAVAGLGLAYVQRMFERQGALAGIPTGLADLDALLAGLQAGDLIVLAAPPSMGKTAFALNLVTAAAAAQYPAMVFSMEMQAEQLGVRLLSALGRVDGQAIRTGRLTEEDWPRVSAGMMRMAELPFWIDDRSGLSAMEIRAACRRHVAAHGKLGLVVVDFLQLMDKGAVSREATEASILEANTQALKVMAMELGCSVVLLSQLNRKFSDRTDKRARPSDLKGSSGIEQIADVILILYRDEVYNPDSTDKGIAEIIVAKQRNGPTGSVRSMFFGQYSRFENFAAGAGYEEQ